MKRDENEIRTAVRAKYAGIAATGGGCGCGGATAGCCGTPSESGKFPDVGYSANDLEVVPEGANMGLGCGNPQAIAALRPGESVLDLGSGGGFDVFLAARQVGEKGFVVGVDMTPEMVEKARRNAERAGVANVEFRLGEIEHLPVADASVDVIMSNCVINLSPDKPAVFREAFRVLRSGGRIAVSDIVNIAPMPNELASDIVMFTGCMAGASPVQDIENWLKDEGFDDVRIRINEESSSFIREVVPGKGVERYVASAMIEAIKP